MSDPRALLDAVLHLHNRIRDAVVAACEAQSQDALSAVAGEDEEGDTIFAIDKVSEDVLVEKLAEVAGELGPLRLVAEGLPGEGLVLPSDADPAAVRWRVIVDPIDGTRGIMYQKRSAWILTGIAPEKGPETGLHDIVAAAMTEIPLVKQHLSDQLSAVLGKGITATRWNRLTSTASPLTVRPSREATLAQGYCQVTRFFPGGRDVLAAIDDEVVFACTGPVKRGKAACFEDQYVSSGGQLYELVMGHDRFNADLRAHLQELLEERGQANGLCCHPYDLCAELIMREAGVIVCDPSGAPLTAALWCHPDVSWVGYANAKLRTVVEPALQASMRKRNLLP
jgi:fructose-1,6-bisphosphatase/inositol monophosphatase family enzyme